MDIRVLFVIPNLIKEGAETQLADLAGLLNRRVFRKRIFTFEQPLDLLTELSGEIEHSHWERESKFDLGPARELARIIDEWRPDVLHCTLPFALLFGWLALRFSKAQPVLVAAIHDSVPRSRKEQVMERLLFRRLMQRCARLIFVSEIQREFWLSKYPALRARSVTVHNGIDADRLNPAALKEGGERLRRAWSIPDGTVVIGMLAAFRPEKAHSLLIKAFASLQDRFPDTLLVLAGDGPTRPQTEQLAERMGLRGRVVFLGHQSDIGPVLGACQITVLPSTTEAFSLAILESLAAAVPVVASDVGGAREAVLDGLTGLIVEPGDPDGLACALARLISAPELRTDMGERGRGLVKRRFTQEAMGQATATILIDAAGRARIAA